MIEMVSHHISLSQGLVLLQGSWTGSDKQVFTNFQTGTACFLQESPPPQVLQHPFQGLPWVLVKLS